MFVALFFSFLLNAATLPEIARMSEGELAEMFMFCSIKFLEGENIYLNKNNFSDRTINKWYPRESGEISGTERANRLMDFNKCQEITRIYKRYLSETGY